MKRSVKRVIANSFISVDCYKCHGYFISFRSQLKMFHLSCLFVFEIRSKKENNRREKKSTIKKKRKVEMIESNETIDINLSNQDGSI